MPFGASGKLNRVRRRPSGRNVYVETVPEGIRTGALRVTIGLRDGQTA